MSADDTLGTKPQRRRNRLAGKSREEIQREGVEEGEQALAKSKSRPTPSRREQEEDSRSSGFFTRLVTGIREYLEGVNSEMRKVVWPTNEDTRHLSTVVLTTLVVSSIVLGAIVLFFTELFRIGLAQPIILIGVMVLAAIVGFVIARMNSQRSSL
ncbi:MAG: preprotein translocase subunit SecE [Anaerolineae bacterium]|nr:preprotein translocase subunit SecE [Anaerolineae bacterium]